MEIKVIGSGSSGNSYWVSDGITPMLLDCGLPYKVIQRAIDFQVTKLGCCLVTHEHGDHAKATTDLLKAGVPIGASIGTLMRVGVFGNHHNLIELYAGQGVAIGSWKVIPFATEHDAYEPLGFYLASSTGEVLLYATDTLLIKQRFTRLTHILIECNNDWGVLKDNEPDSFHRNRVMANHMNLDTVLKFLRANDMSKVKQVYLCHLSDRNSDAERFKQSVQEVVGCEVYVA